MKTYIVEFDKITFMVLEAKSIDAVIEFTCKQWTCNKDDFKIRETTKFILQ